MRASFSNRDMALRSSQIVTLMIGLLTNDGIKKNKTSAIVQEIQ